MGGMTSETISLFPDTLHSGGPKNRVNGFSSAKDDFILDLHLSN